MSEWKPEREVTEELARHLIESQFPDLMPISLSRLGSGWDNVVYQVNDTWLFRFPQRQFAVEGVEREMKCLPVLARATSGIVNPVFFGKSDSTYPWPFFGFKGVSGQEAPDADLDTAQRLALVRPIAQFLRQLHSADLFKEVGPLLPFDPLGRLDFAMRIPKIRDRFKRCKSKYGGRLPLEESDVEKIIAPVNVEPRLECTAVVHGDFHFRHLVLLSDRSFSGVIDWGDLHKNNPAVDLQIGWSFFPSQARREFWSAYGTVSDQQLAQSRAIALFINLCQYEHGVEVGLIAVERESLRSFEFILED